MRKESNYWLTRYACYMVIQEMPSNHINIAILRNQFADVMGEHVDTHKWLQNVDPNEVWV